MIHGDQTRDREDAARGDIEVELKFRVEQPDRLREAVRGLGARPGETVKQSDVYFAHPTRDFASTDEAFRVRTIGEAGCVTYKGPLLDAQTKSREETEIAFADGAADATRFRQMLEQLGFRPVRSVEKVREHWSLDWQGRDVDIAFDRVSELGDFVELETSASHTDFAEAKQSLLALAEKLDLRNSERRSYLSLLLESDGP